MNRRLLLLLTSAVALATALGFYLANRSTPQLPHSTPATEVKAKPSPVVVNKAPSISKSGIQAEIAALGAKPEMASRLRLVEKLAALGPGHEAIFAAALVEAPSSVARGIIADALARLGTSEAVDALMGLLSSTGNASQRADILPALGALPPGQPIETLASSLALKLEPEVRDAIIATIARAADSHTVTFLNELYHEPEAFPGQTANITLALGSIHNPAATSTLSDLLRTNGEIAIKENTATALGKIGTADALQPIADALGQLGTTNPTLRKQLLGVIQSVNNSAAYDWLKLTASNKRDAELAAAASAALSALPPSSAQ